MKLAVVCLCLAAQAWASLVGDVRAAIAQRDFKKGEALIAAYRAQRGVTSEMVLALSWLGRGALFARQYDQADAYAVETRKLALEMLKSRPLDQEKGLPLALGASIEVQAHVMDARGERASAVDFLRRELATYRATSIRTRIQKNIHLLSLEGKPAPPIEKSQDFKGKPALVFFWAHWCGDCKRQAPSLNRIAAKYGPKGLVVIGPTQRYGYVARGREAGLDEETAYIEEIRKQFYPMLGSVPVSEDNFKNWGASTTPTLVLIDRKGIVRLYHPGHMPEEELEQKVRALLSTSGVTSRL